MPNQNIKQLGRNLEHAVVAAAKASGHKAHRQPMSGRIASMPSDVVIDNLLVEAKVRAVRLDAKGARILSIDLDWLDGVLKNAEKHGFEAGIVVVRPKGSARLLCLVELPYFLGKLGISDEGD